MSTIVLAILIGVVSSLANVVFEGMFARFIPAAKKVTSFFIKFLFFSLRYIAPIVFIVFLMNSDRAITKSFIFEMSLMFFAFNFNLLIDFYRGFSKNFYAIGEVQAKQIELIGKQTELIREVNKKTRLD